MTRGNGKERPEEKQNGLQKVIDGIVDPFYIINVPDYKVVFANKAARKNDINKNCLCYAATHHSEVPCRDLGLSCPIEILTKTKQPVSLEHVHFNKQGDPQYFEINAYPLLESGGTVKQIVIQAIDVTKRKINEQSIIESEKRYRQLYEASRDGYVLVNMQGQIQEHNHAFQEMLGYNSQEIKKLGHQDVTPAKWHDLEKKIIEEQVMALGYSELYEKEYLRKDGSCVPVELRTYLIHSEEGTPTGMWSFVRDISERKEIEEKLNQLQNLIALEKRKLEEVLNINPAMASISNLNHLVDFVIEKSTKILEIERCSLMLLDNHTNELTIRGAKGLNDKYITTTRIRMGEPLAGLVAKTGQPLLVNDIEQEKSIGRQNRQSYKSKSFMIVPIMLKNKMVGVVNVSDKKSRDEPHFSGIDLRILCTIVSQAATAIENASNYRELEFLSISDPLTGIFNYRYFTRTLDMEIERAHRYLGPFCLLMLDIDNFKSYNDTYGHPAGDILLKRISAVVKNNLRAVDIVCRYAGDEFVAILPQTNIDQAKTVAKKIIDSIQNLKCKRTVSVSIGVGEQSHHSDRRDLILKTDQALYQAKREGKGRICCFK